MALWCEDRDLVLVDPGGGSREHERGRRDRDVASIEGDAEEVAELRGEPEQQPERDRSTEPGGLTLDEARGACHPRLAESLAEAMVLDRVRNSAIHDPVLEPAGEQTRHP